MAAADLLGIVVVGIGIAGRVRVRDILKEQQKEASESCLPGVHLVGYVSRRTLDIEGVTNVTLEDALKRDDVHAVIVCTENETHETIAKQCLEASKHVLVEFPLALTADGAKQLRSLAEDKGVVVHEEDISLLTPVYKKLKELAGDAKDSKLKEMSLTLQGRPNGWIEDMSRSGSPFVSGISMIHRVLDLIGDASPEEAVITIGGPDAYTASAKLSSKSGVSVSLNIERSPDIERRKSSFSYTLRDGSVVTDQSLQAKIPEADLKAAMQGLFLKDLVMFVEKVHGKRDKSEGSAMTIQALEVADLLDKLARESLNSNADK